jgi:Domain of unknown function (DUF4157)
MKKAFTPQIKIGAARPDSHNFLQRKAVGIDPLLNVPPIVNEVLRSPGQLLEAGTRSHLESHLGHDFSRVRIHTGEKASESADALQALAYTVGRDIVFAGGQYAPSTPQGRRLLTHELVHVMQQGSAAFQPETPLRMSAADGALEQQAESAAAYPAQTGRFLAGSLPTSLSVQRAVEAPSPTTADDNTCAGWFSDRESLTKRAAENYVRTELTGDRGSVEQIECDLFDPGSGAYACTAHFSDGTPIRVIVRKDAIIVSVAPIQSMNPPANQPLCWYDYKCIGPNRELILTKRKCQSAKPAGSTSPGSGGKGPNP